MYLMYKERMLSHISISFVIGPTVGELLFDAQNHVPTYVTSVLFSVHRVICARNLSFFSTSFARSKWRATAPASDTIYSAIKWPQ